MLGSLDGWLLIVAVLWAIGWGLFATISIGVAKLAGRRGVEPRWTRWRL